MHTLAPSAMLSGVLSIGKIRRADYYLERVAGGPEDYYAGRGEATGRWLGRGSRDVGVSGEVTAEQLRAVLAGRAPDGTPLDGRDPARRVPGWDVTLSAPKS